MARRVSKKSKRQLSTAQWFGIGCGGIVVLGLVVAGVMWFMLTGEPPPPPEARAATSPARTQGTTPAAQAAPPLERQIEYVEQAERSEQPVPVTMTVRQSELNDMIRWEAAGEVRDLQVYFGRGTIAATGTTTYRGRNVHLTIRAEPVVSGGTVRLDVREVMIGRLQAPDVVRQQIREEIDRGMERAMRDHKVQISSVQVNPDVMTISGQVGGR